MKRTKNVARLLTLLLVFCMLLIPMTSCAKVQEIISEVKDKVEEGIDKIQGNENDGQGDAQEQQVCTVVVATEPETVYTVDLSKVGKIENGLEEAERLSPNPRHPRRPHRVN